MDASIYVTVSTQICFFKMLNTLILFKTRVQLEVDLLYCLFYLIFTCSSTPYRVRPSDLENSLAKPLFSVPSTHGHFTSA